MTLYTLTTMTANSVTFPAIEITPLQLAIDNSLGTISIKVTCDDDSEIEKELTATGTESSLCSAFRFWSGLRSWENVNLKVFSKTGTTSY